MIVWISVALLAGGLATSLRYPLFGHCIAGAGAWVAIWWAATLVVA